MLLKITTTYQPATDLGYLLHKHPDRCQSFSTSFGKVHVFYPEKSEERCTMAMVLDVDSTGLVRNRQKQAGGSRLLANYVNDRPYVASSFLSVAISRVLGTAAGGRCDARPELVDQEIPLEIELPTLPSRGGGGLIRKLFEPLGYHVELQGYQLDEHFEEWGHSRLFSVKLTGTFRLSDCLSHLYVLVPVLDDEKHYWVGEQEVEKLLKRGEKWLPEHPEQALILDRYLLYQNRLIREATHRLLEEEAVDVQGQDVRGENEEALLETPLKLNEIRMLTVMEQVKRLKARSVLDLGCGEGKLLKYLLKERFVEKMVGVDVCLRSLKIAEKRLKLERMQEKERARIELKHGSLTYRDARFEGFELATLIEVIEHLEPYRLSALECVVFDCAKPEGVIVTTPNADYNVKFENLSAGKFRHLDHRFEWGRQAFQDWAAGVCERYGYTAEFFPVGEEDELVGAPTQMAVFQKAGGGQ